MKIFLVRHGESEGNVDHSVHERMADHAIPLSQNGIHQAFCAGQFLHNELTRHTEEQHRLGFGRGTVRFWCSPYKRTRQTLENIMQGINSCSATNEVTFESDIREDVRLCEQQFGLFDGVPDDQRHILFPAEGIYYNKCEEFEGRFWARMPLGESRFDVSIRVKNFFDSLHRDLEYHGIETVVIICHGVTLRAFVMQWLHLTPEWFDNEPNPGNTDIRFIEADEYGKYIDRGYIYKGI